MSTKSLNISEMTAAQYQKELTFNNALHLIDAVLGNGIISRLATPPGSPSEGDCYIVTATAIGDWAGQEDDIAQYLNGAWVFYTPAEGWEVYVAGEENRIRYDGSAWSSPHVTVLGPETDEYARILKFIRGSNECGCIDNNNGDVRFKALGTNSAFVVNDSNQGIEVNSDGEIKIDLPTTEPADGDVSSNHAIFWLDVTGGALKVKVNDGTNIKSGSIALA